MVIWLIGLSGAGKTTLGRALYERMKPQLPNLVLVDGDEFREVMGNDIGFTYEDRLKNAERFSKFCRFLDKQGIHLICCVLSNFPDWQKWNRENLSEYYEIFVDTNIDILAQRDIKNIYARARRGEAKNVVGYDIPFIKPNAHLVVNNDEVRVDVTPLVDKIINNLPKLS
ncbi:MAG: adenylyl-sulfate kinase [Rhodospirillaceae bacterium]|nr:adenylyl-sulfate kinase [Rhodospirillales bacterium]